MKTLEDVVKIKPTVKPLTDEDRVNIFNETEGQLHKEDGIECEVCRNRGYVYKLLDDEIVSSNCSCMKQRKIMRVIIKSGLKNDFEQLTFDNFETKEAWQKDLKQQALDYVKNHHFNGLVNGNYWFMVSGQIGSGKTHICTAISSELIKLGYDFTYLSFARDFPKLQQRLKSGFMDVKEKAEEEMNRLSKVKVLYIDDFLKTRDLSNVFELIDTRYSQDHLITIISTEKTWDEMMSIDEAIVSRIYERTSKKYFKVIGKQTGRNYRLE